MCTFLKAVKLLEQKPQSTVFKAHNAYTHSFTHSFTHSISIKMQIWFVHPRNKSLIQSIWISIFCYFFKLHLLSTQYTCMEYAKQMHATMQQQPQQKQKQQHSAMQFCSVNLHDTTFTALNITSFNCFAPLISAALFYTVLQTCNAHIFVCGLNGGDRSFKNTVALDATTIKWTTHTIVLLILNVRLFNKTVSTAFNIEAMWMVRTLWNFNLWKVVKNW